MDNLNFLEDWEIRTSVLKSFLLLNQHFQVLFSMSGL